MPNWAEPTQLVRFDDPYHAWAYEADSAAGVREREAWCPVVIEILPAKNTYKECLKALEVFAKDFLCADDDLAIPLAQDSREDTPFYVTGYDKSHFDQSRHWFESKADTTTSEDPDFLANTAYRRLYLVYATENRLFPGGEEAPLWMQDLFKILFVGQAVRNRQTQEAANRRTRGRSNRPDVELTIIDDSIAYLNDVFDFPDDGKRGTRFRNIWFQDPERLAAAKLSDGVELTEEMVVERLNQVGPKTEAELYAEPIKINEDGLEFRVLDRTSEKHQPLAFPISHGTHVASTALTAFLESFGGGDVPRVGLNAITVPTFATQDTSGSTVASYIIAAMRRAMLWNDELATEAVDGHTTQRPPVPLVMNCSYGFTAGPKDGTSRLNNVLKRLLDARNAIGRLTELVVPMGNSYEDETVAYAKTLKVETALEVDWHILPDDQTPSFVELYVRRKSGDVAPKVRVQLEAPDGRIMVLDAPVDGTDIGTSRILAENGGPPLGQWSTWAVGEGSYWDRRAVIALAPTKTFKTGYGTIPPGPWRLKITNKLTVETEVLATVQRDDAPGTYPLISWQSYFAPTWPEDKACSPVTGDWTSSALASIDSEFVFVAGAGMGESDKMGQLPVGASPYASAGPRSPTKAGPDYSTLADRSEHFLGVYGAGTYSGTDVPLSGSSVAAPALAGLRAAKHAGSNFKVEPDFSKPRFGAPVGSSTS